MSIPAIVAVIRLTMVPARTAFNPNAAKSDRRIGARAPDTYQSVLLWMQNWQNRRVRM